MINEVVYLRDEDKSVTLETYVATDIDQQTDKKNMDAEVEDFLEKNGLARDPDRLELGNVITPPEVQEILGYEQMDYYYPVKRK